LFFVGGLCGLSAVPDRVWAQPQFELVSVNNAGTQAAGSSQNAVFSGNGRFIAFISSADTLVPGDTNGAQDVFIRDLATHTTTRVSVATDGSQRSEASGGAPFGAPVSVTHDGTLVAFESKAAFDPIDTNTSCSGNCSDIYLRDRTLGQTTLISVAADGGAANNNSYDPQISADGRFVVFTSAASNLVAGDHNGVADVFLRDRLTQTTTRLSLTSTGTEPTAASTSAHVSTNGKVVAFLSSAALVDDPDPVPCLSTACSRAFVLDRASGSLTRIPLPADILASGATVNTIDMTPDGRYVALGATHVDLNSGFPPPIPATTVMLVYDRQLQQLDVLRQLDVVEDVPTNRIAINPSGRFVSWGSGMVRTFTVGGGVFDRQTRAEVPQSDLPLNHSAMYIMDPVRYDADGLRALLANPETFVAEDTNSSVDVYIVLHDADHDGLPDAWETQFGLNPNDAADATLDSDGDGPNNLQEYLNGTHPKGTFKRYFAEGAANSFFTTRFGIFNPGTQATSVVLEFLGSNNQTRSVALTLAAHGWTAVTLTDATGQQPDDSFSTIVEADHTVVVDRSMSWDKTGYGSSAETAIEAPRTTWYLAEGSTGGAFDLFYLLQNPGTAVAHVTVNYLRPAPFAPIVKTYDVGPLSRRTVYVDMEGAELAGTDLSAKITSDQPILAERAMYFSTATQPFAAGHEGAAVAAPDTNWFLAEGATGSFFDLFLLLANAETTDAQVKVSYLLPSGPPIVKNYTVAAQSRLTINVDVEDPALKDTSVSTIVESTNGVPVIAERAMWWPSPNWYEAHLSAGSTTTGTTWALADGLASNTPAGSESETYILVANTSNTPGSADVTLYFGDGSTMTKTFALQPNSRTNVQVSFEFPNALGKGGFGTIIQSSGPPIVVERAIYTNAGGQIWAAGSDALGTKLQ
jgi:hypothetical protein